MHTHYTVQKALAVAKRVRPGWKKSDPTKRGSLRAAAAAAGVRSPQTVRNWMRKDMSPAAVKARLSNCGRKTAISPELRERFEQWFDGLRSKGKKVSQRTIQDYFRSESDGTLNLSKYQITRLVQATRIGIRKGQPKKRSRYVAESSGGAEEFVRDVKRRRVSKKYTFVMDEKGVYNDPSSTYTYDRIGKKDVYLEVSNTNKRDSIVATISAAGQKLAPYWIESKPAKTSKGKTVQKAISGMNEKIMLDYIDTIIKPNSDQIGLLLLDALTAHRTPAVQKKLTALGIQFAFFPPDLHQQLSACDNAFFAEFQRRYNALCDCKPHLSKRARAEEAYHSVPAKHVKNYWNKTGLYT